MTSLILNALQWNGGCIGEKEENDMLFSEKRIFLNIFNNIRFFQLNVSTGYQDLRNK